MEYEARAKQNYDRLVEMGARPTRPLQLQPTWTATYKDGDIHLIDEEGYLERLIPRWRDPMCYHWIEESKHIENELNNWYKFRKYQQDLQPLNRLGLGLELNNTDAGLINALTSLSDWQDFEVFQYHILADASILQDKCHQRFLGITEWGATREPSSPHSIAHDAIGDCLGLFERSQREFEAARKRLNWIKDQWPKVLAEALTSLSMAPELQASLEAKFRMQTFAAFSAIQKLEGRPSHAISSPEEHMDRLHRLLYWSSETSQYMEELSNWKNFLEWRRGKLGERSNAQKGEYQCPQFQSVLEFHTEFEKFRQSEYEAALGWLKCRQRLVRWYDEEIETLRYYVFDRKATQPENTPYFVYMFAEEARSHLRDSEQRLADATIRLEKASQERAHAVSVLRESIGGETAMQYSQKSFLPSPPVSDTDSLQSPPSFSSSSSQLSIRPTSPHASHSTQPPHSLQSPQPSQSPQSTHSPQSPHSPQSSKRISKDQRPLSKGSTFEKLHRRLKKKNLRKKEANVSNINPEQHALPAFSLDPDDVKSDVDTQMTDAPKLSTSAEAIDQSWGVGSGDIVMTDSEGSLSHVFSDASLHHPKPAIDTHSKRMPSPAQGHTSRKTRSTTKLDQASTSKVVKNKNKKPAKKAKVFTEQQATMLLNAASNQVSATNGSPLRRSERLKEKAAVSTAIAAPQLNVAQLSPPLQQERPRKEPSAVKDPKSSRQKMVNIQSNALEPLPKLKRPRQKKCKIQAESIGRPNT